MAILLQADEWFVQVQPALGADDFHEGVQWRAERGGDLGDRSRGRCREADVPCCITHLSGENLIDARVAKPLAAENPSGRTAHDELCEAQGVDADVPQAAAALLDRKIHIEGVRSPFVFRKLEIEAAADQRHLAEVAGADPLAGEFGLRVVTVHEGLGQHAARLAAGGRHRVDLFQRDRERFLAEHVQAGGMARMLHSACMSLGRLMYTASTAPESSISW